MRASKKAVILPFEFVEGKKRKITESTRDCRDKASLVQLKEWSMAVLKNDLIYRNPLRLVGEDGSQILKEGELGVVLARAGVGKTSLLVQLALDSLLRHKNCLHISIEQPVQKVCLWYEEVFHHIAKQYNIKNTSELWEAILPHRFIMTFKEQAFSVPRLEERLADLTEQGIFYPQMVLLDGLTFNDEIRETLTELKLLARENGFPMWLTARIHRNEPEGEDGLPVSVSNVADIFETIIRLQPKGPEIHVDLVKGPGSGTHHGLVLDPSTLLIKENR